MIIFQEHDSPLGPLLLAADTRALRHIEFPKDRCVAEPDPSWSAGDNPVLGEARRQLDTYFAGHLQHFHLPLAPQGTPFQRQVWQILQTIPFGQTRSYAQIAAGVGRARAVRAVGAANGKNPLPIVIPERQKPLAHRDPLPSRDRQRRRSHRFCRRISRENLLTEP